MPDDARLRALALGAGFIRDEIRLRERIEEGGTVAETFLAGTRWYRDNLATLEAMMREEAGHI